MIELNGLEKVLFTNGRHSPTTQFTKSFAQLAKKEFSKTDYKCTDSYIFSSRLGIYCNGIRKEFKISDNKTELVVTDKGYNGSELDQEDIENIFNNIVEKLSNNYGITSIRYK